MQAKLCVYERRHLAASRRWLNDPELMHLLDRARPVAELEQDQWFNRLHERQDTLMFAIEVQDEHIGNVWLVDIDVRHRKAELRIVIGEKNHIGQGAGTVAIDAMCAYAFQKLNLHKIYAYVLALNPRARAAFEKAHFVIEGTFIAERWSNDNYVDVIRLGRIAPSKS
jgi:RimJ/RimL family protein N-acetyltransferase